MKKFWVLKCIKMALLAVLAVLVIGYVVMSLWNWLVPALFSGPMINFFQAVGILILSKILFGGFKKGGHCHKCGEGSRWGEHWKKHGDWRQHLKEKMETKMAGMTPEEKEKFKKKFGNRCGVFGDKTEEC